MKLNVVLAVTLAACTASSSSQPLPPVTTFRTLLDSLTMAGSCAPKPQPPPAPIPLSVPTQVNLTATDICALASAAIRRLGREASTEPLWAPGDTARVVGITISGHVITQVDSNFVPVTAPDTVARVELDIDGRAKLVWVQYGLRPPRETMGAVHRGPF